ncbi:MAG: hypothetical protein JWP25_85 [Bradyrhizobium sp.]|nr:hypothetical protein [Bradyrhizobium sp.]
MEEFLARILEFGCAIIGYWYVWLTVVPFFIDQILSRNFWSKETLERFDQKWPPDRRHRFFKWVCMIGFVFASFQAFDHVNQEAKRASIELQTTKTDLSTKKNELETAQQALADTRGQLAEANAKITQAPSPGAEQPKATIDLDDNIDINVDGLRSSGTGTVIKGRGSGKGFFKDISSTFADAKFPLVPLSETEKAIPNDKIRDRLTEFFKGLSELEAKRQAIRDNEAQRKAWEEEFKSTYLPRARTLQSLIISRIGGVEPTIQNADINDMPGMMLVSSIRLGRSSLGHDKPIGLQPALNVMNYLQYLAERMP